MYQPAGMKGGREGGMEVESLGRKTEGRKEGIGVTKQATFPIMTLTKIK